MFKPLKSMLKQLKFKSKPALPITSQDSIEKYIFIVTYGRSGSTLVQNLIGRLPGSHIVGENMGVPFKLAKAYQDALRVEEEYGKGADSTSNAWYGAHKLNSDAFGKACAQSIYSHFLQPPPNTRIAGFKEIRWDIQNNDIEASIDFLSRYFSPAFFICNIRDPEATSKSGWWKNLPPEETIAHLSDLRRNLMQISKDRKNCFLVDYDKFSKDPETFKPMFDFIGEPYDQSYVDEIMNHRLTHTGVAEKSR